MPTDIREAIQKTITVYNLHNGCKKVDFDLSKINLCLKDSTRDAIHDLCRQLAGPKYEASIAICCGYITNVEKSTATAFVERLTELLSDIDNVVQTPNWCINDPYFSTLENPQEANQL